MSVTMVGEINVVSVDPPVLAPNAKSSCECSYEHSFIVVAWREKKYTNYPTFDCKFYKNKIQYSALNYRSYAQWLISMLSKRNIFLKQYYSWAWKFVFMHDYNI